MAKSDLMNKREMLFAQQMMIFKDHIGTHAASLGLTPAQVAAQAADADYFNYVVLGHNMVRTYALGWTALKKSLRRGKKSAEAHEMPDLHLPDRVPAVAPGLERRFRTLVRLVKASDNYTPAIGHELGIEAVDHAGPDAATLQPKITVTVVGDHVEISWDWQGHRAFLDLCELDVDRGDGRGFVPLVHSVKTRYTDKTPFPVQPVRWQYRAVYRVGDAQFGNYSSVVGITVPP